MGNSQGTPLPSTMKRIVLVEPNNELENAILKIEEVPLPQPASGEVLIRVIAAPVNPSDYGEWKHVDNDTKFQPKPVGKEGSGIVVASGGGVYASSCVGYKVGFVIDNPIQGSYSEYVTADALKGIFPLPETVVVEDAASHFVNPYTVYGIVETVRQTVNGKSTVGFIHTGAASQLGQMMVKYCKQENVTLINVVRRDEQAEILRNLGAQHIIVSNKPNWEEELKNLTKELDIKVAFDCVSGEMTGKLLTLLPSKSTIFVYGSLSGLPLSSIEPLDLIYRKKRIEGWLLPTWLLSGDPVAVLMRIRSSTISVHSGLIKGGWAETQFSDCTMDNMLEKFRELVRGGFTGQKLRIRMDNTINQVESTQVQVKVQEESVQTQEDKVQTQEEESTNKDLEQKETS